MATPTGPSREPIAISGSAAVPGGPPATSASPKRRTMRSAIFVSPAARGGGFGEGRGGVPDGDRPQVLEDLGGPEHVAVLHVDGEQGDLLRRLAPVAHD